MDASRVPEDIVESALLAIITDPPKHQVVMKFKMREHEFSLRARGVDDMLVNEFLEQNIVDNVRIFDRQSDPMNVRDLLANLLFDCEHASEITEPGWLSKLEECTTAIGEGRKVLLELLPVYGASVLLLAASIEWPDSSIGEYSLQDAPENLITTRQRSRDLDRLVAAGNNISAEVFGGFVTGDLVGEYVAVNFNGPVFGVTVLLEPNTFRPVGVTGSVGKGFGASTSTGMTETTGTGGRADCNREDPKDPPRSNGSGRNGGRMPGRK